MVTHDQNEAMAMSDRIAVMRAGRIIQVDTPRAAYEHRRMISPPPSSARATMSAARPAAA